MGIIEENKGSITHVFSVLDKQIRWLMNWLIKNLLTIRDILSLILDEIYCLPNGPCKTVYIYIDCPYKIFHIHISNNFYEELKRWLLKGTLRIWLLNQPRSDFIPFDNICTPNNYLCLRLFLMSQVIIIIIWQYMYQILEKTYVPFLRRKK